MSTATFSGTWTPATVLAVRALSATVREIILQPVGGCMRWTVGAHLRVQFTHADGRLDERRYSLVGLPEHAGLGAGGHYRIAVRRAQPSRGGSAFMWGLQAGDVLPVQHPLNHFELPLAAPHTLLLAGGIGVTPMLGMAQRLALRHASVQMRYAARTADELVYVDELRAALGAALQTFSDDLGQRIDLHAEIAALHPQAQLLVCGPVPMLHAVQAAWARAGRAPQRLRFETFGNTGARVSETFTVTLPRHGLTLDVPPELSLLEALERAGVPALSNCRRGECGLCVLNVLDLHGEVDHRDVFLSQAEKHEGARLCPRLCACVSRVCAPVGAPAGTGSLVLDTAYRPDTLTAPATD
jgi:ferredoxin-NADP reductase